MPIDNCKRCQKVFQRNVSPFCEECYQGRVTEFSDLYRFLQENASMPIEEVAETCQIPLRELEELLFSGQLGTAGTKVIHKCPRCKQHIPLNQQSGRFCQTCKAKMENEVRIMDESAAKPQHKPKHK